ncbi:MAG TPA: hypothetical protein VNA57_09690 [Acidimicrobiales bacterium]|nr:hypothetical protein [Acidimicrobiales bacterium]
MNRNIRKSSTFAAVTVAAFLATASVAFACVTFKGKVEVIGQDGSTTAVGSGNQHAYCSTGRPATAAAGHPGQNITIKVSPQACNDPGAGGTSLDRLPLGTYEVRYNNRSSYAFDGTSYVMVPLSGCFFPANEPTTSKIGTFNIPDGSGTATWTGPLNPVNPAGVPAYSVPGTASNICVGNPVGPIDPLDTGGPPGILAPFELLAI